MYQVPMYQIPMYQVPVYQVPVYQVCAEVLARSWAELEGYTVGCHEDRFDIV